MLKLSCDTAHYLGKPKLKLIKHLFPYGRYSTAIFDSIVNCYCDTQILSCAFTQMFKTHT